MSDTSTLTDTGNVIRLFVSSTFADFQLERELLQRQVFPELATLCTAEGFRFLPIDLRWGVSEEASSSQRTLPIIFEELRRCQRDSPEFNFLLLLGDRYGSRLLTDTIPTAEYEQLLAHLDRARRRLLEATYQLDENAVPPAYVLKRRPNALITGRRQDEDAAWHTKVAKPLLAALAHAATRAGFPPQVALPYTGSVTHLEVQRGLLEIDDPSAALCVFRTFTQRPRGAAAKDYVEHGPADQASAAGLKAAVEECLATHRTAHPDQDSADLLLTYEAGWGARGPVLDDVALTTRLRAVLERRVRAVIANRRAATRGVHPAITANAHFSKERLEHFVGRRQPLAAIAAYLAAPADVPLLVAGPGGMGKSTILAKAVEAAAAHHPEAVLLTRYIGVTPGAESLRTLLDSLCTELAAMYGQELAPVREDFERARAFREALGWAPAARPLILVLDALDQLGSPPVPLDWLPQTLPPYVHLVASLLDEADRPELRALSARQPAPQVVLLDRMDAEDGNTLLQDWLDEGRRTLTPLQREKVLAAFAEEGRPLYLRLAFEEARRWHSFDAVAGLPPLDPTIPGVLRARLLEEDRSHLHYPPNRRRLRLESLSLRPVGGPLLRTLTGHTKEVAACAFSLDGQQILSASRDRTLRLWDVASGQTRHVLVGHTNWVQACAFSPDGQLALSASRDRTLRLWDVTSGSEVSRLDVESPVVCCAFSSSDTWLAAGDARGAVHFFRVVGKDESPTLTPAVSASARLVAPAALQQRSGRRAWWQLWRRDARSEKPGT